MKRLPFPLLFNHQLAVLISSDVMTRKNVIWLPHAYRDPPPPHRCLYFFAVSIVWCGAVSTVQIKGKYKYNTASNQIVLAMDC